MLVSLNNIDFEHHAERVRRMARERAERVSLRAVVDHDDNVDDDVVGEPTGARDNTAALVAGLGAPRRECEPALWPLAGPVRV